jgi:pSer/pThr/pTyr-binding forkhead associated (FHA) protein
MHPVQGRLVPEGGGDNIDLNRPDLVLGRRPSCDIQMEYPNISGKHLRLCFKMGYWTVEDLGSTNGIKVNGVRVQTRTVYPGDTLTIGKRNFKLLYELPRISAEDDEDLATAAPVTDRPSDTQDGIDLSQSLMEKAGISRRRPAKEAPKPQKTDRILYKIITIYYIKSLFLPNKIGCHSGTFFRTSRRHPGRHRPQPITYGKGGNFPTPSSKRSSQTTGFRPCCVSAR